MKPIFLIDDSPTILMSMTDMLVKAGYKVEKASSGGEALARLSGGGLAALSLMITDYHMPGMTGVELIRQVRKLPSFRFTPILVLTTESQQDKRNEAKSAGATGWLVKPVPADKLLQVIKQVVPAA
jgi:two-component system, chemotaxis family, chemotaxis protein CheY